MLHHPTSALRALVALASILIPSLASAQPAASAEQGVRPRFGLALGGGSARGFAHIGVLQWFDEHRIPVDEIAGTSMGGLVGGFYATGMSPADIRQLMRTTDWDAMFQSDSPYEFKTFRRKQDKRAFPSPLEFGLKNGVTLPGGLNPGQQVALMLDRIALPYYAIATFDDLPTPFRCVATDLKSSEPIVLGRGPLSRAMRATMAIPGVFTPVTYDRWLLVDGGALNNVPVNVTRQMGADVVIAVNVSGELDTSGAGDQSLFTLLGRTIDTVMAAEVRKSLASADLVIVPNLKGLDSMSWRQSDELANRGYQAAAAMSAKLLRYAVSESEYSAFVAARRTRQRTAAPTPESVTVVGVLSREQQYIREELAHNVGRPVDPDRLALDILRIGGTDRYEHLTYEVVESPDGPSLLVTVHPKSHGPPFLDVGIDLNNVDSTNFAFNLAGRVTTYDRFGAGSELRTNFVLGTRQAVGAELYKPIAATPLFVAPRLYFSRAGRNEYVDEALVAEHWVKRAGGGIDVGISGGRYAELRLGYDIADVRARLNVGNPTLPEVVGLEQVATAQMLLDGQDSPIVPSHGVRVGMTLKRYFEEPNPVAQGTLTAHENSPRRFWQAEVRASAFERVRGQDRVFGIAGGGTSFGAHPLYDDFSLGGPMRMGAFNTDELRGANYLLGVAGYLRRTGRLTDVIGGNVFVGGWIEAGSAFADWKTAAWHGDVAVGVVVETLIGPVFAGGSVAFGGQNRLYVSLGPLFR
ncbi:MAG TPA: patatin-like phospholipase family protein [Vicinamibacterales bacterium]|jgi:NTE family protein